MATNSEHRVQCVYWLISHRRSLRRRGTALARLSNPLSPDSQDEENIMLDRYEAARSLAAESEPTLWGSVDTVYVYTNPYVPHALLPRTGIPLVH